MISHFLSVITFTSTTQRKALALLHTPRIYKLCMQGARGAITTCHRFVARVSIRDTLLTCHAGRILRE